MSEERYWRIRLTTTAVATVVVEGTDEADAELEAKILGPADVDWEVEHENLDVDRVDGECDWAGTLKK